ncbi:MAG: heme-binding domain-containing protein [Salinimicrobium sp.]
MKALKIFLVLLLVGFIIVQFFPVDKNINTDIEAGAAFEAHYNVPPSLQETLRASCYDCHSNNTTYLWYDNIQPVLWYIESHIEDGKHDLNFDEFDQYSAKKQQHKLEEIAEQVEEGEMPLKSYTLTHWNAKLSEDQKKELVNFFQDLAKEEQQKLTTIE